MSYCGQLVALRRQSMRRGVWYRVLNRLERAQVNWTVRIVKRVRSSLLAHVLDLIIEKLMEALESRVLRAIRQVGIPAALRLSRIAQSWGHKEGRAWARDRKFVRFLAVMSLNEGRLASWKTGL